MTLKYLPTYWYFIWRFKWCIKYQDKTCLRFYGLHKFCNQIWYWSIYLPSYWDFIWRYQRVYYTSGKKCVKIKGHVFWTKFCKQIWIWSIYLHIDILYDVIKLRMYYISGKNRVYCKVNLNNLNPSFLFTNKNINPIRDHLSITSGSENSNFCWFAVLFMLT